jgi:hypothetical protein
MGATPIWSGSEERGRYAILTDDGRIEPAWDSPSSCVNAMADLAKSYAELHRDRDALKSSLRDTFAAAALPAIMGRGATRLTPETYAKDAYRYADAMLAAREGK